MMAVVCPRNQKLTSQHFVADARIRNGSAAVNKRRDKQVYCGQGSNDPCVDGQIYRHRPCRLRFTPIDSREAAAVSASGSAGSERTELKANPACHLHYQGTRAAWANALWERIGGEGSALMRFAWLGQFTHSRPPANASRLAVLSHVFAMLLPIFLTRSSNAEQKRLTRYSDRLGLTTVCVEHMRVEKFCLRPWPSSGGH